MPDWTVLGNDGAPALFLEVHTDMPARETFARMHAWHGLSQRIRKIPSPIVLILAPPDAALDPPDAGTAKRIAQDLQHQLLRVLQPVHPIYHTHGFAFLVIADRRTGRAMASPFGMYSCFEPPSCMSGWITADRLLKGVEKKVSRFQSLARDREVPLVVGVGSHIFIGVAFETLDGALLGSESPQFSLQFGAGYTFLAPQRSLELKPTKPWPEGVAGLVWIDTGFPFEATTRRNPNAWRALIDCL